MAIRDDFTAGEVLAAADLNDTFASKVPFSYGTATPTTTVEGFIWFDESTTPPTAKVWDGSDFVTFSGAGNADFSDAATGTYTDSGVDYKFKTYTGSGSVTITKAGFADVLVVGGGAGGGGALSPTGAQNAAGGGGAGGFLQVESAYLLADTYTVTIGAGGAGSNATPIPAKNGVASKLSSYIAAGGGFGGVRNYRIGGNLSIESLFGGVGGSAGGCSSDNTDSQSGISGLGNAGGQGSGEAGGGGGGASAAGSNGSSGTGGAGGNGSANSYTGSSVTYAGGGGGGGGGAAGGSGGGGAGGSGANGDGVAGTANTGGGGGGGVDNNLVGNAGGNGGSGVVIIRVRTN